MVDYVDGKRYRVTRDYGVMKFMQDGGYFHNEDTGLSVGRRAIGITAELDDDPLPATRGSVVRYDFDGRTLTAVRGPYGWIDSETDHLGDTHLVRYPWTLIYDAGAQQS